MFQDFERTNPLQQRLSLFLKLADLVLVMTVEPGFGGQSFMLDQVEKIKWLCDYRKKNQLSFEIEVDGGVNLETRKYLDQADILVAGSYIFICANFLF